MIERDVLMKQDHEVFDRRRRLHRVLRTGSVRHGGGPRRGQRGIGPYGEAGGEKNSGGEQGGATGHRLISHGETVAM